MKLKYANLDRKQRALVIGGVSVFTVLGVLLLQASRAASNLPYFEAEKGTLSGGARTVGDDAVSGKSYVSLGSGGTNLGSVWRMLTMRTPDDIQANRPGGEGWQFPHSIARSASNPDVLYITHDCGQVWRSRDNGVTWRRTIGRGMYALGGQSVNVHPQDPNLVIATIDNIFDYTAHGYQGIYRSTDGGDSWTHVKFVDSLEERRLSQNVAYDPSNPNLWYAGFTGDGLYASSDTGLTWNKVSGLAATIYSVQVKPGDGSVWVATSSGLFKAASGGANLSQVGSISGEVSSIAFIPNDAMTVYAMAKFGGLYRSTNAGASFSLIRGMGDARAVFVNPAFPSNIWITSTTEPALYSPDGGASWQTTAVSVVQTLGRGWMNVIGNQEQTGISPDPRTPNGAVAFSMATLWRTNNGTSFVSSSDGFGGANFVGFDSLDFDPTNLNRMVIWAFDFGLGVSEDSGRTWDTRIAPFTMYQAGQIPWLDMSAGDIQPGTDTIVAAVGKNYFDAVLIRSTDMGRNWSVVNSDIQHYRSIEFHPTQTNLVFAGHKVSYNAGASFQDIPTLAAAGAMFAGFSKSNPDILFAVNANTVFRSTDRGVNWQAYTSPGWNLSKLDPLQTFTIDPNNPDKVYSVDVNGDLAVFDGMAWRSLGVLARSGEQSVGSFVRSVVVDPSDSNIIYAGMYRTGASAVWRSTDGGANWTDVSGNVPRAGAWKMAIHPTSGEVVTSSCCGMYVLPPPYPTTPLLYANATIEP